MRALLSLSATVFVLSVALLVLSPASPLPAQEPKAPLDKVELTEGDCIVFLGDSITHQRLYTQYVEDYFYTRMPHTRLKLHNAGVSGARASDALARFGKDVASYKPKYVTILLGMNDGTYRPFDVEVVNTYQQDMTELLDKLDGIGATAIPMTPTMFDTRVARTNPPRWVAGWEHVQNYNALLAYLGTWLRAESEYRGLGFVDMWSPLNNITHDARKTEPSFTMIADAVHPGPDGQVVMATAMITDMGLPRQVSNIRIFKAPNGELKATTSNGEVTDLQQTDDGVSFTWMAKALPWVLPEDAALGVKLTKLGHKLSREALEVHNLPQGRYKLSIDGEVVGTYASTALARHIELQANAKTPQYQQALEVAMLNKQRNEGPLGELRGLWSQFQRYARAKKVAEENPGNEELQKQVAAIAPKVENIDQQTADANAKAKEIEDRIFEINQPKARKYALKKVSAPRRATPGKKPTKAKTKATEQAS